MLKRNLKTLIKTLPDRFFHSEKAGLVPLIADLTATEYKSAHQSHRVINRKRNIGSGVLHRERKRERRAPVIITAKAG